uniref:DNA mismatch repair protein MLH3 n=1 Tax=Tetraselmis sp. GSL018 TaxID=582737 RepID=A0A061QTW8_9CHLO
MPWLSSWCNFALDRGSGCVPRVGEGRLDGPGVVPGEISFGAFAGGLRALGSCEAKFIPAVCTSSSGQQVLVIIDQHAADERVLLEEIQNRVLAPCSDGSPAGVTSTCLEDPVFMRLTPQEATALEAYGKQVQAWGWRVEEPPRDSGDDNAGAGARVAVTAAPAVLGVSLNTTELRLYLSVLAEGAAGAPVGVRRLLASKACRGAIMFGDRLSRNECQLLAEALRGTELSFSCAHGRPTMVPICSVSELARRMPAAGSSPYKTPRPEPRRLTAADLRRKLAGHSC